MQQETGESCFINYHVETRLTLSKQDNNANKTYKSLAEITLDTNYPSGPGCSKADLTARFFIHNSGMRMARMRNARVLLFRIHIPEWTEHHSIHCSPRDRMNRMLRMHSVPTILIPEL